MSYMIWVENARRRDLAILSGPLSSESITEDIEARVAQLDEQLRTMPGAAIGRHVAVYHASARRPNASHWLRAVPVEVGVECVLPLGGVSGIEASGTPEGLVATTEHVGPRETLPDAHAAVRAWCRSNGWEISGTSWEVYGRWSGAPDHWRTAVYYLVR
jgi:effector-binding domain-containing protein